MYTTLVVQISSLALLCTLFCVSWIWFIHHKKKSIIIIQCPSLADRGSFSDFIY